MIGLSPDFERDLLSESSYTEIVGIDEVGRGCWAGPVVVGAYFYKLDTKFVEEINDSKKTTHKKREQMFGNLESHKYEVSFGSVELIDKVGIGKAIEKLMLRLVNKYDDGTRFFLIDGQFTQNFGNNSLKVLKGDSTYYSIAAASILAKYLRDSEMIKIAEKYPGYNFDKNKGYGTKNHIEGLDKLGVCDIHRKSYKPIQIRLAS